MEVVEEVMRNYSYLCPYRDRWILALLRYAQLLLQSNGVKFQNQLLLDLLAVARVDKRQGEHLLKRTMVRSLNRQYD